MTMTAPSEDLELLADAMQPDPHQLQTAFDAGSRARREDRPASDNPYPPNTMPVNAMPALLRRKWYEGWCETNLRMHLAKRDRP